MPGIQGTLIAIAGASFFFYMTRFKGLILIVVLFLILMGLIYFKQNMLLYMPGNLYMMQLSKGCLNHQHKILQDIGIPASKTYNRQTFILIHRMELLSEVGI